MTRRAAGPAPSAVTSRDRKLIAALTAAHDDGLITATTLRKLKSSLLALAALCGPNGVTHAIVKQPDLLRRGIEQRWASVHTRVDRISSCLSALKYDTNLGTAATREFWKEALRPAVRAVTDKNMDNVLTEREAASMPDFDRMRDAVTRLRAAGPIQDLKQSLEHLWLLIALCVPAKRADYGAVAVVSRRAKVPRAQNAVVVPKRSDAAVTLVLNTYKTSGTYGTHEEELADEVGAAIRESLAMHPRKTLFVNALGRPFSSKDAWAGWVHRAFQKHLGGKHNINGLRKAWVEKFADGRKHTLAEQTELARKMLHSPSTQRTHYVHVRR